MRMQMPFRMGKSVGGLLMKAHCVRKGRLEEIVISRRDSLEDVGQRVASQVVENRYIGHVMSAAEKNLERPNRPEWNQNDEVFVFADYPFAVGAFEFNVVAE